jgi:hypothetical protein
MEPLQIRRMAENLRPRNQSADLKNCRIPLRRIYRALSAGIIPRMTRHKHTHTGLVTPQLPQLWLTAVLRLLAMLVSNVASSLQMIRRHARVNATRAMPTGLPRDTSDIHQETQSVAASDQACPIALILRSAAQLRVSKDEGVLTTRATPLKSFSALCRESRLAQHRDIHSPFRSSRRKSGPRATRVMPATGLHKQPWIPACAGMSGERPAPNKNAAA